MGGDKVWGRVIPSLFHLSFFRLTIADSCSRFDITGIRYWTYIVKLWFDKGSSATLALQMAVMSSSFVTFPHIEQFEVLLAPIIDRRVHLSFPFDQRLLLSIVFSVPIFFFAVLSSSGVIPNGAASNVLKWTHAMHLHCKNKDISSTNLIVETTFL